MRLSVSDEKVSIKFKDNVSKAQIDALIGSETDLDSRTVNNHPASNQFITVRFKQRTQVKEYITHLKNKTIIDKVDPVYMRKGAEILVYDRFIIQFKPFVNRSQIEDLCKAHGVEILEESTASPNLFTFRLTPQSDLPVLKTSNIFAEALDCDYAMPDFWVPAVKCGNPNDPYFNKQYYLTQTAVPQAWDITKGDSTIKIAVIDDGVSSHEEFGSRLLSGIDYNPMGGNGSNDDNPFPDGNEAHGTACAGIIAASQNNNKGISGIAPNCKILPIKIYNHKGYNAPVGKIKDAIDFAWQSPRNADVISCSWGFRSRDDSITVPITAAINRALTNGRSGKGCVIVFAAGNEADRPGNTGYFLFPSYLPGIITVGAINRNNNIWYYSPRNVGTDSIDVVAPSGGLYFQSDRSCEPPEPPHTRYILYGDVWSLDISGSPGHNPGNYFVCDGLEFTEYKWDTTGVGNLSNNYQGNFGGTSAAAPQVAGVAALILSVNPNLTYSQVSYIIRQSADRLTAQNYDQDFGYGRINACNALLLAGGIPYSPPVITAPSSGTHCCGTYRIQWTSPIAGSFKIELSTNGGQSFTTTLADSVSTQLPNETYFYDWNTSGYSGTNRKIRITNKAYSDFKDTTDAFFVDTDSPATPGSFDVIKYPKPGGRFNPKLLWTAVPNVSGYYLWKANSEEGNVWERFKMITDPNATSYVDNYVVMFTSNPPNTVKYKMESFNACGTVSAQTAEKSINYDYIAKQLAQNEPSDIPKDFNLGQNYPNPFNPSTKIEYTVPKNAHVTIKLYNTIGAEVATLVNEDKPAGYYEVTFDGSHYASGMYFYRMMAGEFTETRKLILVK